MSDKNLIKLAVDTLTPFIGQGQMAVMRDGAKGEEAAFFVAKLVEMAAKVDSMPLPYGTRGQGEETIAQLHYFKGSADWWIIERDNPGPDGQIQAFGLARLHLGDDAELGYINIAELIANGVELDLHWHPITLAAVRAELEKRTQDWEATEL